MTSEIEKREEREIRERREKEILLGILIKSI